MTDLLALLQEFYRDKLTAVLRHPDIRRFITGRFLFGLAVQTNDVGIGWFVYDVTDSGFALGAVGLAAFLPAVLLMLVTGYVSDRFDRRHWRGGCNGCHWCDGCQG